MKALMFGWEFPPHISGGLGTACFGLTRHMARQGADIIFVLPKVRGDADGGHVRLVGANRVNLRQEKIEPVGEQLIRYLEVDSPLRPYFSDETYREVIHRIQTTRTRLQEIAPDVSNSGVIEMSGDYGDDLLGEVARYAYVGSYLGATEDFDIIHAHDWLTALAGAEARAVSGKPMVFHIHATEYDRTGDNPDPNIANIERCGLEQADRVIAVSHRTRDMVVDRYGIDPSKIRVVHNAVDKDLAATADSIRRHLDERIVLFLGRITIQKGPDYFVEAASRVLKQMDDVRFVMAGNGDMLPKMIERVASLRIQDKFHFTGFLRGSDWERMFSISDLYVMPSVSEPFGITPFEAMMYGVPTIISKQSGISEVLAHAVKVDFWDVDLLAERIVDVLSKPGLSESLIAAGREELKQVSWDKPASKVLDVYKELGVRK